MQLHVSSVWVHPYSQTHTLFLSHTHTTENQKFRCNWTRKVFRNINTIPYAHIPKSTQTDTHKNQKEKENLQSHPNQSQRKRKQKVYALPAKKLLTRLFWLKFSMRQSSSSFSPFILYRLFPSGACGISQGGCMQTQAYEHPQLFWTCGATAYH